MKSFEFVLPTHIKFGEGVSQNIANEVQALGHKKPMVVTDKGLIAAGIVGRITDCLEEAGISYCMFDEIEPNPRDTTVMRGYALAQAEDADMMIAIGGGSSMDTAKAIGVLMTNGGKVGDYEGLDMFENPISDLIAIPTTVGTGSEVTFWSVITDTTRHFKMSLGSPKCAAKIALVDPDMVATLPASIIAATASIFWSLRFLSSLRYSHSQHIAEPTDTAAATSARKPKR